MKPLLIAITSLATGISQAAISFNLNFENINPAGVTWDANHISVVTQAANEWGSLFVHDYSIDVDLTFTSAGISGYLGQWAGNYAPGSAVGDNIRPWENAVHKISFNADRMDPSLSHYLWWDADTSTPGVASNHWDALTVARHEFGHLLGFSADFYVNNVKTSSEVAFWEDLIDPADVFDPGGLAVLLEDDHGHISASGDYPNDLMVSALKNGTRREISELNLQMLQLAYGYSFVGGEQTFGQGATLIPEPGNLSLGAAMLTLIASAFTRRKRASRVKTVGC